MHRRPEDSDYTVDVLTRCSVSKDCSGKKAMKIVPPKERGEPVVISLPLSQHSNYMPKDLLPVEARENTLRKVEEVLSRFAKDGVPLLDPEEDMKVQSKSFRKASRRIEALASLFEKHDIRSSLHIQQKLKVLHDKQELSAKMKSIKKTMQASTALAFKDELKAQKRVLRRLAGTLKHGAVEQMVALLSCFVWQEKLQDASKPREELDLLFYQLQETARRVSNLQLECKAVNMLKIPEELENIIKGEAPRTSKGESLFERANGKVYTAEGEGTFLIQLIPTINSPESEILTLQYRWNDLYFVAFHVKGQWFRLRDDHPDDVQPLPPTTQIKCQKKDYIVQLPQGFSYDQLGGSDIQIGEKAFKMCYKILMTAPSLAQKKKLNLLKEDSALALPVVAFSEALRFPLFKAWILKVLRYRDRLNKSIPPEHLAMFEDWVVNSRLLFSPNPSPDLVKKLGILKKSNRVPYPRKGSHDHEASSSGTKNEDFGGNGRKLVRIPQSNDEDASLCKEGAKMRKMVRIPQAHAEEASLSSSNEDAPADMDSNAGGRPWNQASGGNGNNIGRSEVSDTADFNVKEENITGGSGGEVDCMDSNAGGRPWDQASGANGNHSGRGSKPVQQQRRCPS
nr:unnamed protein product [Digitaria exilis]